MFRVIQQARLLALLRLAVLAVATSLGLAPAAQAERDESGAAPRAVANAGGTLWLRPNPDLFEHLGVRALGLPERGEWSLPLWPSQPVEVELGDGALQWQLRR